MNRKNRILAAAMALLILVAAVFAIGCKQKGNDEPPKTPSTSITLDKETMSLDADASDQLTASGADEVVWTSDNPAVATVDANGKVTDAQLWDATNEKHGLMTAEEKKAVASYVSKRDGGDFVDVCKFL